MMETRIIDGIVKSGTSIGEDKSYQDDDFVDRVNHTYTMNLLMFFTAIVLSRQLVGKPISCWIPNDFTGAQGEYAETVCWVTSTYFIPPAQTTVPIEENVRYEKKIYYYQWVPFILMIQAALFVLPCIIWRLFSTQSKINLRTVMEVSSELKDPSESQDQRRSLIDCLVRYLEDALAIRHFRRQHRVKKMTSSDQRHYGKGWSQLTSVCEEAGPCVKSGKQQVRLPGSRPCLSTSTAYLSNLYLVVKAFYLVNSASQLVLTGKYLNGQAFIFGIDVLRDLMNTRFWDQTGSFPRVALCDFELLRMGSNQHRYTIQCVLRINLFNEKIYIFLWFWFFFVSLLNLLSLLRWCYKLLLSFVRVLFVRNLICIYFNIAASTSPLSAKDVSVDKSNGKQQDQLSIADIFKTGEDLRASQVFSEDILGQDGVLLLRFINMNVGPSSAAELAGVIWIKYKKTAISVVRAGTNRNVENVTFSNAPVGGIDRVPVIPPKRSAPPEEKTKKKKEKRKNYNMAPLSSLIYQSRYRENNDSDRSSDSSRATIDMLHERRRYRPMYRRRNNYSSDEDDVRASMSAIHESCSPEAFLDIHEIPDSYHAQDPEDFLSQHCSFNNY